MEINNRKSIYDNLDKYTFSSTKNDYIEITEWINGEGWDICINSSEGLQKISLSYGELDAINYLIKHLEYGNKESIN